MNTTSRRRIAAVLQIALAPIAAVALGMTAATLPAEGGWTASGAIEQEWAAETAASKDRNEWTTKALREAGYEGCSALPTSKRAALAEVEAKGFPSHHVVRLPVAEGWDWTTMSPAEVAERMEAWGGTSTTSDDPKIVANCWPTV